MDLSTGIVVTKITIALCQCGMLYVYAIICRTGCVILVLTVLLEVHGKVLDLAIQ
tara:strand:+ start:16 stop:180 length:165 start_codon:yes stop_codon:yes gene_type:complete